MIMTRYSIFTQCEKHIGKTCTGFSWSPTQSLCIHNWGKADILGCMFVVIVFNWWCGIITVHYWTIIAATTHAANPNYAEFWFQYHDKAYLTLRNEYSPIRHSTRQKETCISQPLNTKVAMDSQSYFQPNCQWQIPWRTVVLYGHEEKHLKHLIRHGHPIQLIKVKLWIWASHSANKSQTVNIISHKTLITMRGIISRTLPRIKNNGL